MHAPQNVNLRDSLCMSQQLLPTWKLWTKPVLHTKARASAYLLLDLAKDVLTSGAFAFLLNDLSSNFSATEPVSCQVNSAKAASAKLLAKRISRRKAPRPAEVLRLQVRLLKPVNYRTTADKRHKSPWSKG